MNWKPELEVDGNWAGNAQVFATKEEAEFMARNIFSRWLIPTNYRAVETDDPINYEAKDGRIFSVYAAVSIDDSLRPKVQTV